MLSSIAKGDAVNALQRIEELSRETPDWMALVSSMQSVLHQVAVAQIDCRGISHLSPDEQRER